MFDQTSSAQVCLPNLINESSQMREERHAAGESLLTSGGWPMASRQAMTHDIFCSTLDPYIHVQPQNSGFKFQVFFFPRVWKLRDPNY